MDVREERRGGKKKREDQLLKASTGPQASGIKAEGDWESGKGRKRSRI